MEEEEEMRGEKLCTLITLFTFIFTFLFANWIGTDI